MTISEATAEQFLKDDTQGYYSCVIRRAGDVCNASQIAALTSFCFNVGIDAFCKSTLLKVIKSDPNNFTAIKLEFMKWVHGGGKVLPGLVKRREVEFEVYCDLNLDFIKSIE